MSHVYSPMPFPRMLRWALLAPVAVFLLAMFVPALFSPIIPDNFAKGAFLALIAAAGLVELIAVPVALFMLLRGGPYVTLGNVVITVLAAIPLFFVGFIALVLKFGHFHI
jgi:hypothetical protein